MTERVLISGDNTYVALLGGQPSRALLVVGPFDTEEDAIRFATTEGLRAYKGYTLVSVLTPDEYRQPQ